MKLLVYLLVICVIMCIVTGQRQRGQRRPNRNNNRGQLRSGRQQQQQRGFRNNNTRNNRNNNNSRNNNNNRRPKQSGGCSGGNAPNYKFQGQDFLISWRMGCSKFRQGDAERFCSQNGMRAISLDSRAKEDHFLGLIAKDRQRYFWTGGKVNNGKISWPSRKRYNDVNWSNTGGAGRPQPDNREGDEFCLAVLNNFYADGIRFHDVSCHHKKPVICEAR